MCPPRPTGYQTKVGNTRLKLPLPTVGSTTLIFVVATAYAPSRFIEANGPAAAAPNVRSAHTQARTPERRRRAISDHGWPLTPTKWTECSCARKASPAYLKRRRSPSPKLSVTREETYLLYDASWGGYDQR